MDEKESLKIRKKIEAYKMVSRISKIVGPAVPIIGLMYYPINPGLARSFGPFWFPFLLGCFVAIILLGELLKSKASILESELKADKERERRRGSHFVSGKYGR